MVHKSTKNKFKSEVRIGLLVIIVVLLGLNVVTNYILYQNRTLKRESLTLWLDNIALTISRNIKNEIIPENVNALLSKYKTDYKLKGLILTPTAPIDKSKLGQTKWITEIASQFSPSLIPELTRKILESDERKLTKGENDEYYYVYPLTTASNSRVLILSVQSKELAYLDNSSNVVFIISIAVAVTLVLVYFLLYRYILSPFKQMKDEAIKAGRNIDDDDDIDVEATISDYLRIINELRDKEQELVQLNEKIIKKANRLEEFNQYLLESMMAGMIIFDNNGNILSINKSAENLLDINPNDWIGKTYKSINFLSDKLTDEIKNALTNTVNLPYQEFCINITNNKEIFAGTLISTIYDEQNNSIGLSLLLNDVTELKRLQKELEKNERLAALGEMAGGLAHQLRNSLGAIMGYNSLIIKKFDQNNIEKKPALELQQETKEAESLINRFLSFAKPFELTFQDISIVELFDSIVEKFKLREDFQKIDIDLITILPENYKITIDPLFIKQALANIIENAAFSYNGDKGRVLIKVAECDQHIKIDIQDFGCGIDPENIDRIFTPFYSSRPSGNGLGLPLAKKIIDMHNGQLTVTSENGDGTNFNILLPIENNNKAKSSQKIRSHTL